MGKYPKNMTSLSGTSFAYARKEVLNGTEPEDTEVKGSVPVTYFGGKSKVAARVWQALGQPKHYIEPFFGSGAVLLARPDYEPSMIETVNDKDGYICNVWRALRDDPDEVAKWCDWPVNHADLMARRKALIKK